MGSNWKKMFWVSVSDQRMLILWLGILIGTVFASLCFWAGGREKYTEVPSDSLYTFNRFFEGLQYDSVRETSYYYRQDEQRLVETFPFDPNTADSTQLLRLGLSPWQVRNIYTYRARGGKYHRPDDFSKLYGLTKGDYDRLKPYIRIADEYKLLSDVQNKEAAVSELSYSIKPAVLSHKFDEGTQVDINKSDTSTLKRIPGIGSYYARRIVTYREQLGGFVSLGQLAEIEGLPTDIERWFIEPDKEAGIRLNLNRASLDQLNRHPYLNFYQSRVIVEHRRKHGPIKDFQSLSFYEEFTEDDFVRLSPYVFFGE